MTRTITVTRYISPPQDEDGNSHVSEKDRAAVRQLIVELMLRSPEQVQRQLSDAISVVGRCDFPARWPNLIGDLTSRFSSGQYRHHHHGIVDSVLILWHESSSVALGGG